MYNDDSSIYFFHPIKKFFNDNEDSMENINENQNEEILFKPNCYFENLKDKTLANNVPKEILTKATNYDEKHDYFENHFLDNENSNCINEEKMIMNIQFGNKSTKTLGSGKYIHDKYSDDNLRRMSKHLVLKATQDFINGKINEKDRFPANREAVFTVLRSVVFSDDILIIL